MKKFIVSVLCAAVFFIGLGGLADKAAAGFKSDERALEIIKQARAAIGGESNIANVRALTITGKATQNLAIDGATRTEQGDLEINMQLPNKFSKTMRFGDGVKGDTEVRREVKVFARTIEGTDAAILDKEASSADGKRNIVIMRKGEGEPLVINSDEPDAEGRRKFVIRKSDGTAAELPGDGKIFVDKDLKVSHDAMRSNELFRTAFALLLTAPEGTDASYTFAGEADVDGNSCNVIVAQTGGESFKLYLDKSTSLPRMMSYQAVKPLVFRFNKEDARANGEKTDQIFVRRAAGEALEKAEFQVKFSDYRSVGGLQLPFSWTQTIAGQTDQTIDISNYDINPAGIAEKFSKEPQKVRIRMMKPELK